MNRESTKEKCTDCGAEVSTYDGVYFSHENTSSFLCSKCYNRSISESMGLDFDYLSFHPIALTDGDGADHIFHFQTRLFGDKVNIQALEIRKGVPKGYEFSVHGDAEEELFGLFAKLADRLCPEESESCPTTGSTRPQEATGF